MRGLIAATALLAGVHAVDPIIIKGSKFFYQTNGTQFFMKGVAYQQDVSSNTSASTSDPNSLYINDPLADQTACARDIPVLQKISTNTIRVYAIDPTKDHSYCMSALANAGIYVVADLSQPGLSINRNTPAWTTDLYARYTSVVDEMMKYNNTLGFFAGNEVSNQPNNTYASAFVKAAVRDTKAYIKSQNYRPIGVGYATNDDAIIRENMADYFDCGDSSAAIDFWGYNIYSWCGDSSFTQSGYDVETKNFQNYNVPVFFAEYGCNTPRPRLFTEVGALYGQNMTSVWSGGIVYMYFEEANQFGLATIGSNGQVQTNQDYANYAKQIAKVKPSGVNMNSYNPTNTAPASCPSTKAGSWGAVASPLPPPANANLCSCMMDTLSCVVADNVPSTSYGAMFSYICSQQNGKYCTGINTNATSGPYGTYGMCSAQQQLSNVLNVYAKAVTNGCAFKGQATSRSAPVATPTGTCSAMLKAVGAAGTGTVSGGAVKPTSSGSSSGGSSSNPNTSGSPSTQNQQQQQQQGMGSSAASPGVVIPRLGAGIFGLGVYVFAAVMSGMAMIFL